MFGYRWFPPVDFYQVQFYSRTKFLESKSQVHLIHHNHFASYSAPSSVCPGELQLCKSSLLLREKQYRKEIFLELMEETGLNHIQSIHYTSRPDEALVLGRVEKQNRFT